MAVDITWPLEHGVFRHRSEGDGDVDDREAEAVHHLVSYISELANRKPDQGIRSVIGYSARANAEDRQVLAGALTNLVDHCIVASEPFLVTYGLEMFNNALTIYIGAETTDLCRRHGTILGEEDQRTLLEAGNPIDSRFHMVLQDKVEDSPLTLEMARNIKEQYAFVSSQKEVIYVDIQANDKPKTYDATKELREACGSVLPKLITRARELIFSLDSEFQHELRQNILLVPQGRQPDPGPYRRGTVQPDRVWSVPGCLGRRSLVRRCLRGPQAGRGSARVGVAQGPPKRCRVRAENTREAMLPGVDFFELMTTGH